MVQLRFMEYQYSHAILGGTFDHFHAGHAHFISTAFDKSEKVTIGLTTDKFFEKKSFPNSIENYKIRKECLTTFLSESGYLDRTEIIPISDIYGTSLQDESIDTIFVTRHGLPNAKIINMKRMELGFSKLTVVKVTYLRGEDGKIISSTRIRSGEIDRLGQVYSKMFDRTLLLPQSLRKETKNTPSGKWVKDLRELEKIVGTSEFIIAVGDVVSSNLIELGRQADVSVIDYKVERKPVRSTIFKPTLNALNDPGTINSKAVGVVNKAIGQALRGKRQVIKITGEEDLLTLAATLLAPLGVLIIYGMPGKGTIVAEATENQKGNVKKLLDKFARI